MHTLDSQTHSLNIGTAISQDSQAMAGQSAIAQPVSLADMAEELSLHIAQKAEEKHHAERKVRTEQSGYSVPAQAIIEFFQQTRDEAAQAKLMAFAKNLLSAYGNPRQMASQSFQDTTQQYLALQYALQHGEKNNAPAAALDDLREVLLDLELEHGPEIRASLNCMPAAHAYGDNAEQVLHFQQVYRDTVLGQETLPQLFQRVLTDFPDKNLQRALSQLTLALGQDVATSHPSTSPVRLHALLRDLHLLETATTVLERTQALAQTLSLPEHRHQDLMHDLVYLSAEQWVPSSRFDSLSQKFGLVETGQRITLLNGIRAILRDLPLPVFSSLEVRQNTLDAVLNALETAIDEE